MALVLNAVWRWRNFFRGLFLLPWITSTVIIALTWRWMFDAFPGRGFFNSVLLDAGRSAARSPSWPRRPAPWPPSSWPTGARLPVLRVSYWPACRRSRRALRRRLRRRRRRLAALSPRHAAGLKHILIVTIVLSFILTINDFNIVYVMTRGGPARHQVFATYSYESRLQPAALGARRGRSRSSSSPALVLGIALVSRYLLRDRE